jgi:hypothetical protein
MADLALPTQSFLALAAIGWADGSLRRIEATGLLRAARECGVAGADLSEIEQAITRHVGLDAVDVSGMPKWQQVLTYALASWFAWLDGVASTDERETLARLGDALGLEEPLRVRAAAAAGDIACLPEGGRPERYDFPKLIARLRERLPQLKV